MLNDNLKMISYKIVLSARDVDLDRLSEILYQTKRDDLCIKNVFQSASEDIRNDVSSVTCEDFVYYKNGDFIYLNFVTDHIIRNDVWVWLCEHYFLSCDIICLDYEKDSGQFLTIRDNKISKEKTYDSTLRCMFFHDSNQFWYSIRNVLPKMTTEKDAIEFIDGAFSYVLPKDREFLYYIMIKNLKSNSF